MRVKVALDMISQVDQEAITINRSDTSVVPPSLISPSKSLVTVNPRTSWYQETRDLKNHLRAAPFPWDGVPWVSWILVADGYADGIRAA